MSKKVKVFAVGIDLGRPGERTAIAVVERVAAQGGDPAMCPPNEVEYHVRELRSLGPKVLNAEIVKNLFEIYSCDELSNQERTEYGSIRDIDLDLRTIVDQTAVGSPIVDDILRQTRRLDARRVIISDSAQVATNQDGLYCIPKKSLIGHLAVFFQNKQLKISKALAEARHLVDELDNLKNRKTPRASSLVDLWREEPSDYLIFAVAIALYELQLPPSFRYEFL